MVKRTPYEFSPANIIYNHFHGFCSDFLNELGIPSPPGEDYLEAIVPAVESALDSAIKQGKNLDYLKYDAVLIDEGQDFKWEWYNLLSKFLTERDELLFVCDQKQNIYGRDLNWIEGGMRNVKFRGRWRELKTIYRLPKKIGDAASRFSDMFKLDKSIEVESYKQSSLSNMLLKPHFIWKNIDCREWLIQIRIAYDLIRSAQLRAKEGHPSDIVILLPSVHYGITTVKNFKNDCIETNHVFEDDLEKRKHRNKKAFWLGDSRLKICTYHSFKGWEARHVILLVPEKWDLANDLDSLVYTAITRTRENIIVLNCNDKYTDFGKNYPTDWAD
jgi:superfamily I DNA/RNA helicase